jgi:ribosomal protein S18 acetylase RimI-like enzyme
MIRQISFDAIEIINPMLTKLREKLGEDTVPPNFIDSIKKSVSEGKSFLYGATDEDGELLGIGLWGDVSKVISLVFADDANIETHLLDEIFTKHSVDTTIIRSGGLWITDTISEHLVNIGFRKIDRAYMTLSRKDIEATDTIKLPMDMNFEVYNEKLRDEVAGVVFKGNDGHIDQLVFPNFFGGIEESKNLLEAIENSVYGDYKESSSWVLKKSDEIIGACFMTIRNNGDTGYIPDIAIIPDYQGQGLGKALLLYSMKKIIESEPDMVKIDLDVTLENNARYLYKSIGFETVREYSMYTWWNRQND